MITRIEVDGFKSLSNFSLTINPGLNILVGPNGAGKTNIILFFEFLSNAISHPIGNAVTQVGGAGVIFQKRGKDEYKDSITGKIRGSYQVSPRRFMVYEYSFSIKISFSKDNVFFEKQSIKIKKTFRFDFDEPAKDKWDLDIATNFIDNQSNVVINNYDAQSIDIHQYVSRSHLPEFIKSQNPSYYSLVRILTAYYNGLYNINIDLKGGETFNVIPSKVRELEDSATPPGIRKDGSGLTTTLYAMKKSNGNTRKSGYRPWFIYDEPLDLYDPRLLDKIILFLKAANSTIQSLSVENDPFNNKLLVKVPIKTGDYEAVLPLSAMSDGTLKWLTLITAILTSKTIFSIEEPENFLHPWMQAEIAAIMRNHLAEKKGHSFVLMTTHSESLLNHAEPEEIIMINMIGGTVAKRISSKDRSMIKKEISKSGLGLGHFYFSDALNNE